MTGDVTLPINLTTLEQSLQNSDLSGVAPQILQLTQNQVNVFRHGDLARWVAGLNALPSLDAVGEVNLQLNQDTVAACFTPPQDTQVLSEALQQLAPWRKGPYRFGDVEINTEWRSDWKWNRIKGSLSSLAGRTVLDVGCGNGYHCWRLKAAGAATVLGIDPSPLFLIQFMAMQRYAQDATVNLLPLTLEAFTIEASFDTVLSMGVMSHRRDPKTHLQQLKRCLKPGGELLLETLILPGDTDETLTVGGRYARMRNVWSLPTAKRVEAWLGDVGFRDIRCTDATITSTDEQRTTEWMPFESLAEALDPDNPQLTIEGHPRPCRGVFVAQA